MSVTKRWIVLPFHALIFQRLIWRWLVRVSIKQELFLLLNFFSIWISVEFDYDIIQREPIESQSREWRMKMIQFFRLVSRWRPTIQFKAKKKNTHRIVSRVRQAQTGCYRLRVSVSFGQFMESVDILSSNFLPLAPTFRHQSGMSLIMEMMFKYNLKLFSNNNHRVYSKEHFEAPSKSVENIFTKFSSIMELFIIERSASEWINYPLRSTIHV